MKWLLIQIFNCNHVKNAYVGNKWFKMYTNMKIKLILNEYDDVSGGITESQEAVLR